MQRKPSARSEKVSINCEESIGVQNATDSQKKRTKKKKVIKIKINQ